MDSPLVWMGGKSKFVDKLVEIMSEHTCYVEVFGGAAWLLFGKPESRVEVYNDLNGELVNLFRVLRTDSEKFLGRVDFELYSRGVYDEYLDDYFTGKHFKYDNVERAFRFFYIINASYNGIFGVGWSYDWNKSKASKFFNKFDNITEISRRLRKVQIDNKDFEDCIKSYDGVDTLYYCCLPGTKIRMKDERLVNIEDVIVGDEALVGGKVLDKFGRLYDGDIYKIKVMGIMDELCVTKEHPIAVFSHGDIKFVRAEELKLWDSVLVPCGEVFIDKQFIVDDVEYYYHGIKEKMSIEIPCDYETGSVFGLWLAEGSILKQGNIIYGIEFSFSEKDIDEGLFEYLDEWFYKHFKIRGNLYNDSSRNSYTCIYQSKMLGRWFLKLFGEHAKNKYIDTEFVTYKLEFQKGLLRGWLDGDGGFVHTPSLVLEGSSRSEKLIYNMYIISLRLGLRPSLRKKHSKDGGIDYIISFAYTKDIDYIYDNVKDVYRNYLRKVVNINGLNYVISPITKIDVKKYSGYVHNITTEKNVYVANFVHTHNCDPPYVKAPVEDYYFRSLDKAFTIADHQRLYVCLKNIKGKFILSYDDCEWVRSRYGEFNIIDFPVHYSSSGWEKYENELIITNYDYNTVKKHIDLKQGQLNF